MILHPELLSYDELKLIERYHGDAIEVARVPGTEPQQYAWRWIADEPKAEG